MCILVMLTQHVSSIIMLIVRRTDYTKKKSACDECLQYGKEPFSQNDR